jgi:hypothetical protein
MIMLFKGDSMSPRTLVFLSVFSIPILVLAGPVTLKNTSGTVEFKPAADAVWSQANPGVQIPSGGQVRTGVDGRAELRFANKASVWMKPSTNVALEQQGARRNRIVLTVGSLKIRVPHLGFRDKFEIKTPTAVASVRGTVFSASADEKGENLQTLFGQVDVKSDDGRSFKVIQGMGFDGKTASLLSRADELAGLENWAPGIAEDQRRRDLEAIVRNRQEIRDFARDAVVRNNEVVQALAAQVKEADFAAGRTLTDVNGNLVRVEQILDRPTPATIEVVDLTMRTSYNFGGQHTFSYHCPSDSRTDVLIAKAEFNRDLPTKINDFPSFFVSNKDSVKIDYASLVLANTGSDASNIATVALLGERQSKITPGASDDIQSNLYVGNLTGIVTRTGTISAQSQLLALDGKSVTPTGPAPAGLKMYKEDSGTGTNISSPKNSTGGQLYNWTEKEYSPKGDGRGAVWLCTENYVINNSGAIRNISDYTGGGANISDLLNNSAAESIVYVKGDKLSGNNHVPDDAVDVLKNNGAPEGTNIDLVIIPDLFYAVVKTLATSADTFNTTH